ncbi:MAG TPA: hypothetical protein VHH11_06960 [Gammaproteobacteria bacterium]|jgi:hypothetical protein|nr:hypothetical protein [Gammaproteobacteria bacterium]
MAKGVHRIGRTLAFAALAPLAWQASAGDEPQRGEQAPAPRVTIDKSGRTTRIASEHEVTIQVELPASATAACAATIDFEYQQRDTFARAVGTIRNTQCAASAGDYTWAVRIRDAHGEVRTLEFPQQWQRSDDGPVEFTHDLPIGPNVDLLNVRARQLTCKCTETGAH